MDEASTHQQLTPLVFVSGAVKERLAGQEYIVEGSDARSQRVSGLHVFGAFTRRHPLRSGDHVMAPADQYHLHYLPGVVTSSHDGRITVKLCNNA